MAQNSEFTKLIIIMKYVAICLLKSQNIVGVLSSSQAAADQFKGIPIRLIGSKIENRLDMFYEVKFSSQD